MPNKSTMHSLRVQISMQMNKFFMIQNAVEDASEEISDTIFRHLLSTRLEVLEDNWAKFQKEHERICGATRRRVLHKTSHV